MPHPAGYMLSHANATDLDPTLVADALAQCINELDELRIWPNHEPVEQRLDRLELAVLVLATSIANGINGRL